MYIHTHAHYVTAFRAVDSVTNPEAACMPNKAAAADKMRAFLSKLAAAKRSWTPLPTKPPSAAPAPAGGEGGGSGGKKGRDVGGQKAAVGKVAGTGGNGGKGEEGGNGARGGGGGGGD